MTSIMTNMHDLTFVRHGTLSMNFSYYISSETWLKLLFKSSSFGNLSFLKSFLILVLSLSYSMAPNSVAPPSKSGAS